MLIISKEVKIINCNASILIYIFASFFQKFLVDEFANFVETSDFCTGVCVCVTLDSLKCFSLGGLKASTAGRSTKTDR